MPLSLPIAKRFSRLPGALLLISPLLLFPSDCLKAQPPTVEPAHYGPLYVPDVAGGKKLIANGWDTPDTAFLREHLASMAQQPLDGTAVILRGQSGNEKRDASLNSRETWVRWQWQESWFAQAREDLKAVQSDRLTDNFVRVNVTPGNLDWFDDRSWAAVCNNIGILTRIARDTGLAGLILDPESYRGHQFAYPQATASQPLADYQQIARQRGQEVMAAIADNSSGDFTVLGFRMLSYVMKNLLAEDPAQVLKYETYGLYPSFIDGLLDALPPRITLVEGIEDTYLANSTQEFLRFSFEMRQQALRFISPENHARYRQQVQLGAAIYLDAYINPEGSRWRIEDHGQPMVERFRQNLTNALAISDRYVWFWGERSHWFETASTPWHAQRQNGMTWQQALPGLEKALAWARAPQAQLAAELEILKASGRIRNLLRNGEFMQPGQKAGAANEGIGWESDERLPAHWSSWQKKDSSGLIVWEAGAGRDGTPAAVMTGVQHGTLIQVRDVRPGQQLILEATVRTEGEAESLLHARWRQSSGDWLAQYHDRAVTLGPADAEGWQRAAALITVPERARRLVLLIYGVSSAENPGRVIVDQAGVYELGPEALWSELPTAP